MNEITNNNNNGTDIINSCYTFLIEEIMIKLPVVHWSPFQPAKHVQRPSVCLQVLQLEEQELEQFFP